MAHDVRLHGGPWHGRLVSVEDGRNHFHILSPVIDLSQFDHIKNPANESPLPDSQIKTREGMYSVVLGSPDDFEWDGWRSHD